MHGTAIARPGLCGFAPDELHMQMQHLAVREMFSGKLAQFVIGGKTRRKRAARANRGACTALDCNDRQLYLWRHRNQSRAPCTQ